MMRDIKKWASGLAVLLIIGAGIWGISKIPGVRSMGDPLSVCVNHGGVSMHIHPRLEITINGKPQDIPAEVGNDRGCMRPMHMHDTSNTVHIESPVKRDFTLGQFFKIWEKPFSRDQIFDHRVDETHELAVTVNGYRMDTYENTVLRDKDVVLIEYRSKVD
ncbi:hypothetical protein HY628_02360 [Candidatus Uhrbacteria bacterium]|nr:hypothetical protein [Candidatus Uhrbacteria bacterium]